MPKKILVDKEFLFKITNQVDSLTKKVSDLENIIFIKKDSLSDNEFRRLYNNMVEANLRGLNIKIIHNGDQGQNKSFEG